MPAVAYFPYAETDRSVEAEWLGKHHSLDVRVAHGAPSLNEACRRPLPAWERLDAAIGELLSLPAAVAEGPGGLLWAAVLRAHGFKGSATVLPYLNPRGWHDVAAAAIYRRFADEDDRVFLGSTLSAAVYQALGVETWVGEPFGIDDELFRVRPEAAGVRAELSIPPGPVLLFSGRAQPDKDLYRVLRVGLKAGLLFPDLQVVIASHVVDPAYMATAREQLDRNTRVHFVTEPTPEQLAGLYNVADVFVTASTSHFETFGRAPAEALACGAPVVAPRYDGFAEVLDQPGGTLVDVEIDPGTGTPHAREDLLLRAIYDILSAPHSIPREEVAALARRRFGRSRTLGMLAYLAHGAPGPPRVGVPPASIELPPPWREPLAQIAARDPLDALAWFWDDCDHDHFACWDGQFASEVRRSLCAAQPHSSRKDEKELTGCR